LFNRYKLKDAQWLENIIKGKIHDANHKTTKKLKDLKKGNSLWYVEIYNKEFYVIYNMEERRIRTFYTKKMAEREVRKE